MNELKRFLSGPLFRRIPRCYSLIGGLWDVTTGTTVRCDKDVVWKANYFKSLEMASRHGTCAVVQMRAFHVVELQNVTFSAWCGARCIARGPCAQTEAVGG